MTTTPEEHDCIAQVCAEDDAARKPRPQRFKDLPEAVPPAGGEVEVLGYYVERGSSNHFRDTPAEGRGTKCTPLVDRDHATRLQAEVDQWKSVAQDIAERRDELKRELDMRDGQRNALQSELTKARELLGPELIAVRRDLLNTVCNGYVQEQSHALNELREFLAHQSAPSDQNCEWEDTFGPDYTGEDAPAAKCKLCSGFGRIQISTVCGSTYKSCECTPAAKGGE